MHSENEKDGELFRLAVAKRRFNENLVWAQDVLARAEGIDESDPDKHREIYRLAGKIVADAPLIQLLGTMATYERYNNYLYDLLPELKHVESTDRPMGWA